MRALSLSRPWPEVILKCGKTIENRNRADGRMPYMCGHRGPLLLHAAGSWDPDVETGLSWWGTADDRAALQLGDRKAHRSGVIVARCRVVGQVSPKGVVSIGPLTRPTHRELTRDEGLWWMGGWGLVLAAVEPTPLVSCPGRLGLWHVPPEVVEAAGASGDEPTQETLFVGGEI